MARLVWLLSFLTGFFAVDVGNNVLAQPPSESDARIIREKLIRLTELIATLKSDMNDDRRLADVEVFAKGAEWILRHDEFYKPEYGTWTIESLDRGIARGLDLTKHQSPWIGRVGSTVFGYVSLVDRSLQPFAVMLPDQYDPKSNHRWPLHVELHGRGATLNEISFIHAHENKPLKGNVDYIQLDVFGRTNNAYRWAGEADVWESIAAVKKLFRIDDDRVVIRGFSMGGAGAWHLGLHHPSYWSSVGAGAGFCDTVHHLGLTEPLSPLHSKLIRFYDAQDYALNAFNVPTIGYGGELDKQIFASKTMTEKAAAVGVTIPRLIGPNTEHKWHPDSLKEFMAFLADKTRVGRPRYPAPDKIRFVTHTPKFNSCFWLTVEQQIDPYEASIVEAQVDSNATLSIQTKNVAVLQVARERADAIVIDAGQPIPLGQIDSKLASAYFEKTGKGWIRWDDERGHKFLTSVVDDDSPIRKRHNLQGPIDDAFMESFVCVRPTGIPWSTTHAEWTRWTLSRFEREFDKWMRGRIPIINDSDVSEADIANHHLILFGDPNSNSVMAKLIDRVPVKWTDSKLEVASQEFDSNSHGLTLIYPNPLNPKKYVVINSGHTFHETEFKASNANLFPKLGDIAVIKFEKQGHDFREAIELADVFDAFWRLSR